MIVVNLARSMPRLLEQVRLDIPNGVLLEQLQRDTTGEWSGVSKEAVEEYAQYVTGVYAGRIASVYTVTGCAPGETPGRLRFEGSSAVELAGVIGHDVPGGPWKRGEARPIRYLDTRAFIRHFDERGVFDHDWDDDETDRRMVSHIRQEALSPGSAIRHDTHGRDLLGAVDVAIESRGGIRITVPMGTRVTVIQRNH